MWEYTETAGDLEVFKYKAEYKAPTNITVNGTFSAEVELTVEMGDVLGFAFSNRNPLGFTSYPCYSTKEQLRYIIGVPSVTLENSYAFTVAPFTSEPCREFYFNVTIGKLI